jgi:hypothetical protein
MAAQIAHVLQTGPFSGHLFLFRSKRADYSKTGRCGTVRRVSLLHLLRGRIDVIPARFRLSGFEVGSAVCVGTTSVPFC